jgi:hypothetical protein
MFSESKVGEGGFGDFKSRDFSSFKEKLNPSIFESYKPTPISSQSETSKIYS